MIIIILNIIIILLLFTFFNKYDETYINYNLKDKIPKIIVSTYFDKTKIPNKVYKNIKKYALDYKLLIYDDEEIAKFLNKYYDKKVLNAFLSLNRGAHKADLFRYCYLYKFGGIYLDIKTELIKDINQIFNKPNVGLYTVLSMHKGTIYQGIIASKPNNPIFLKLIDYIVNIKKPIKKYFEFTEDFYRKIISDYKIKNVIGGYYGDPYNKFNLYLFQEKCTRNAQDCKDGLDKYRRCCYVYDNDNKIIKTRYSDYPW